MFRWLEVSVEPYAERYEVLSEQLNSQGCSNTFENFKLPSTKEEWLKLKPKLDEYQGVRLGRGWGEGILKLIPDHSVHVAQLGAADCLVKSEGAWWPRSAAYEGLLETLAPVGEHFDLRSQVLIVGAGAMARTGIAVLFREGFKKFSVTALDQDRGRALLEQLRRVFIGAEFKFVPKDELILLPGVYGAVLNTTPSTTDNTLLQELAYFNFMAPRGVAIDLYFTPPVTQFLLDAKDVGAQIVPGFKVAAATDRVWAQWSAGVKINDLTYAGKLEKKFQSLV
jgi:shikimate 5-dehydrogenase